MLAFSYAIVAIAITLLTLDLEVRPGLPGDDLARALHQVLPAFGADVLSFVILGQLWLSTTAASGSSLGPRCSCSDASAPRSP